MYKTNKFFNFIFIFMLIALFTDLCYCSSNEQQKIKVNKKSPNYTVYVPPVLSLDSRTALNRDEINIINKKTFNNLLKFERVLTKEINTIGLKHTQVWIDKMQYIAKEIKKHPNTIVIIEGFRNTELSEAENLALSEEHALFVATVFRETYDIKNTIAVIGQGLEKNENFIYNCVIISLIKDINPSQTIQ